MLILLCYRSTRITKNSATLVGNILTNCCYNIEDTFQSLINTGVSDHLDFISFEMKLCDTDTAVTHRNQSYSDVMIKFCLLIRRPFIVRVVQTEFGV